ncbi:MAG: patatin family protein [Erysipelotrichaceae bacterium]|nr:patatin family protein [Erysipelotrichaceae bacterium]
MKQKVGLVMEGGAMRGLFTAGVLDAFMNHGIEFAGAIGVSAGAVFGQNVKSRQVGRILRYNLRFCQDERYCSIKSLLETGDLYNVDFCYHRIPEELDPFDAKTFDENPMEFYVVTTNCETGEPYYKNLTRLYADNVDWFRASASMPMAARPVRIGDYHYLDGGISDSIPLRKMEELGYERNVVIETRPANYIKRNNPLTLAIMASVPYPKIRKALALRPKKYQEQQEYVIKANNEGRALVIRPDADLPVSYLNNKPKDIQKTYDLGYEQGLKHLEEVKRFIAGE